MNPIFDILGTIIKPITDVVDNLHTSEEEKLKARAALVELQVKASQQLLDYESKLMKAKADIITAEAQGQSWMQRSWRPITMLTFLALVVADSFAWLPNPLAKEAWTLLQLGLSGYILSRGAEKITPNIAKALKKDV